MGRVARFAARATIAAGMAVVATLVVGDRASLSRARASLRTSSAPGVAWYEAIFDRLLGSFYDLVADDVAAVVASLAAGKAAAAVASRVAGAPMPENADRPRILEIGPGPGGLAIRLATRLPDLRLTGVDIDPAMVDRARARAAAAGADERLAFVAGDVAALPFADASFDLVTSTFSVHHWADAPAGFAEIRRVLRPGGRAIIYDLPDAWCRFEAHARPLAAAAAAAFPAATVTAARWPGPFRLPRRLEAVRPA